MSVTPSRRCLACGAGDLSKWATATDVEYCTIPDAFTYYRCASCAALSIDPVPSDRLAEIYPPNYYSFAGPGKSFLGSVKAALDRSLFRSLLARIPGESLRVLDVGGGSGAQLDTVRAADPRVRHTQVVDIDPHAAQAARARGHQYFIGTVEQFSTTERFDLVVLLNVIEHVADPGAVLQRLAALLSPSGVILVKTPNPDALDARLFRHANWCGYHCPRHFVLFTRGAFERVVARAGLRVETFGYTQGAPFWAASVLCWLAGRGLARVSRERPVVYHPLFGPLAAAFAAFDFARRPFSKTSQMFLTLRRGDGAADVRA